MVKVKQRPEDLCEWDAIIKVFLQVRDKNVIEDRKLKRLISEIEERKVDRDTVNFNEIFDQKLEVFRYKHLAKQLLNAEKKNKKKQSEKTPRLLFPQVESKSFHKIAEILNDEDNDEEENASTKETAIKETPMKMPKLAPRPQIVSLRIQNRSHTLMPNKKQLINDEATPLIKPVEDQSKEKDTFISTETTIRMPKIESARPTRNAVRRESSGFFSDIASKLEEEEATFRANLRRRRGSDVSDVDGIVQTQDETDNILKKADLLLPRLSRTRSLTLPNIRLRRSVTNPDIDIRGVATARENQANFHDATDSGLSEKSIVVDDHWVGDPEAIGSVRRPRIEPYKLSARSRSRAEIKKIINDAPMYPLCSKNCNKPSDLIESMLPKETLITPFMARANARKQNKNRNHRTPVVDPEPENDTYTFDSDDEDESKIHITKADVKRAENGQLEVRSLNSLAKKLHQKFKSSTMKRVFNEKDKIMRDCNNSTRIKVVYTMAKDSKIAADGTHICNTGVPAE